MPEILWDVRGIPDDDFDIYTGPDPVPGAYHARVDDATLGKNKDGDKDMVTVRYKITEGDYKGWAGWDRLVLTEAAMWKVRQFVSALRAPEHITTKKAVEAMLRNAKGKPVGILLKEGYWNDQKRIEVSRVYSLNGAQEEAGPLTGGDISALREEGKGGGPVASAEPEPAADEATEPYTEDELNDLSDAELKTVAQEHGISIPRGRTNRGKLITAILDAQEGGAEDSEEDDSDETEEAPVAAVAEDVDEPEFSLEDLQGMELGELRKLAGEYGVEGWRRMKKPQLVTAIYDAVGEGAEAGEDEDSEEPPF